MIHVHVKTQRANGGGWEVVTTKPCNAFLLDSDAVLCNSDRWLFFRHRDRAGVTAAWRSRAAARRAIARYQSEHGVKIIGGRH